MAGGYLIHGDIKTENGKFVHSAELLRLTFAVFLQPTDSSESSSQAYPNVKVADFGLSRITSRTDDFNNQARDMQRGTEVWYAPEIRSMKINANGYLQNVRRRTSILLDISLQHK